MLLESVKEGVSNAPSQFPESAPSRSPRVAQPSVGPTDPGRAFAGEETGEPSGGEGSPAPQRASGTDLPSPGFSDFDLENADPAMLKQKFTELRAEHAKLVQQIPDQSVLQDMNLRAQAWDRLTQSPEFFKVVQSLGGEEGEAGEGEGTPNISSMEEFSDLSDETKGALQKVLDEVVDNKVRPIREEFHSQQAKSHLEKLAQNYGEDWSRLETSGAILQEMKSKGIDAETAFLALRGREMMASQAESQVQETHRKIGATTEGDGSLHGIEPPRPKAARSIAEAMDQAEQSFDTGFSGRSR